MTEPGLQVEVKSEKEEDSRTAATKAGLQVKIKSLNKEENAIAATEAGLQVKIKSESEDDSSTTATETSNVDVNWTDVDFDLLGVYPFIYKKNQNRLKYFHFNHLDWCLQLTTQFFENTRYFSILV